MLEQIGPDTSEVAEILRQQFPDLSVISVEYLGEGYDSTAFDVNGEWVFRFPKRDDVERQLLRELRAMPVLAQQSPLPVPAFSFHGQPSPGFPRHFGGYAKLPGAPAIGRALEPTWAPLLARFLSWLHGFPIDDAVRLGMERRRGSPVDEVRREALDDFEHLGLVAPEAPLPEWYAYLAAGPRTSGPASVAPVLVHGDFAAEHVLAETTGRLLTGVIDWSEIGVGDVAVDLAGLFHWGGRPFVDAVLSTYDGPVDEDTLARAAYLGACRGVGDVTFGLETGRSEYVQSGVRALSLCIDRAEETSRRAVQPAKGSALDIPAIAPAT
jgi:aminoglycoside phosphotransferase (APT) family kinase protein